MRDFLRFLNAALAGVVLALLLALCLYPSAARASVPVGGSTSFSCSYASYSREGSTPVDACTQLGLFLWAGSSVTGISADGCTSTFCMVFGQLNGSRTEFQADFVGIGGACPANSTLAGSACECDSGFVESGASCVDESSPNQISGVVSMQPFDLSLESAVAIGGATLMLLSVAYVLRILRKALESSESE